MQSLVNKEMMVICQVDKVGEAILNKNTEHFFVCGGNEIAIPLKFNKSSISHAKEVTCSSCKTQYSDRRSWDWGRKWHTSHHHPHDKWSHYPTFHCKNINPTHFSSPCHNFLDNPKNGRNFWWHFWSIRHTLNGNPQVNPILSVGRPPRKIKTVPTTPSTSIAIADKSEISHALYLDSKPEVSNKSMASATNQ